MRKSILSLVNIFLALTILGCSKNMSFNPTDLPAITPLKLGCSDKYKKIGYQSAGLTLGSFLLGPIGLVPFKIYQTSVEKEMAARLPRFSDLVIKKFYEKAPKEISNWPEMMIEEKLIDGEYLQKYSHNNNGGLMLYNFKTEYLHNTGLRINGDIEIRKSNGDLCWGKSVYYKTNPDGRNIDTGKFMNDDYKILLEEMDFAANFIADEIIKSFKGSNY